LVFCFSCSVAEPVIVEDVDKIDTYLANLEDYLNSLKTFSADFVQTDQKEKESKGYFLLKRPDKMKLCCQSPAVDVLVAKDSKITRYNRELKEKTVIPVHASPLSFFLEPKISLRNNVELEFALEDNEVVTLLFSPKNKDETEGTVFFTFKKEPMTLLGWEIVPNTSFGANKRSVKIILNNIRTNTRISDEEFEKLSS
jgi:outer membrane lipoprotein-sorting protein